MHKAWSGSVYLCQRCWWVCVLREGKAVGCCWMFEILSFFLGSEVKHMDLFTFTWSCQSPRWFLLPIHRISSANKCSSSTSSRVEFGNKFLNVFKIWKKFCWISESAVFGESSVVQWWKWLWVGNNVVLKVAICVVISPNVIILCWMYSMTNRLPALPQPLLV